MNKKLSTFACMFFLQLSSNNIFCMDALESPEFAFISDIRINLDEINFKNIGSIDFNFDFFKKIVSMYCRSKLSYLSNSNEWMDSEKRGCPFCNEYDEFSGRCGTLISRKLAKECALHDIFYAQKLFIDQTTELNTISDLHADFDALITIFNNMHNSGDIDDNLIIKGNNFLIGLGDYVDRKNTSLRTLAFLLIIALKNPGRVILLRGNHEDLNINLTSPCINVEIESVFGKEFLEETYKLLVELYELMPSVLYVAQTNPHEEFNDFWIFSHALLDFKFDPSNFLDFNNSELMKNGGKCFCIIEQNIFGCEDALDIPFDGYGFVWHDIGLKNSSSLEIDPRSNRHKYAPVFIKSFCRKYSNKWNVISGIVGGHDHYFAKHIYFIDRDFSTLRQEDFSREFTSAVGYINVTDNTDKGTMKVTMGLGSAKAGEERCFTMVKFASAPVARIAYEPTSLVIRREVATDRMVWTYKVVEGVVES